MSWWSYTSSLKRIEGLGRRPGQGFLFLFLATGREDGIIQVLHGLCVRLEIDYSSVAWWVTECLGLLRQNETAFEHLSHFSRWYSLGFKWVINHSRVICGPSNWKASGACLWLAQATKALMVERTRPKNNGKMALKEKHYFQPSHRKFPGRQEQEEALPVRQFPMSGCPQSFLFMGSGTFGVSHQWRYILFVEGLPLVTHPCGPPPSLYELHSLLIRCSCISSFAMWWVRLGWWLLSFLWP